MDEDLGLKSTSQLHNPVICHRGGEVKMAKVTSDRHRTKLAERRPMRYRCAAVLGDGTAHAASTGVYQNGLKKPIFFSAVCNGRQ